MEMPDDHIGTTRLGWHHLLFQTPRTWEVVGYGANPLRGQLALRDRKGETMHVFWDRCDDKPDLVRRLLNAVTTQPGVRMAEQDVRRRIAPLDGWEVFWPEDDRLPVRACRHEEEAHALLYVVLPPHPDTQDRRVAEGVLQSFAPNDGEERVWAAFGLDITLPKALELDEVHVLPASQVLRFENEAGESVTVHRYGMLSALLAQDDMGAFFARVKGKKQMLYSAGEFRQDGRHPGVRLTYRTRGPGGLRGFMAPVWQGRAWVWRCDEMERLYCVDNNAREKHLIADLPERVRCQ